MMQLCGHEEITGRFKVRGGKRRERKQKKKKAPKIEVPRLVVI